MWDKDYLTSLLRLWIKKTRDFLTSNKFREFLFFLFFVFVAFCFWMLNALNGSYETTLNIRLKITDVPDKMVFVSEIPTYIKVRVKDTGGALMGYLLSEKSNLVKVPFEDLKSQQRSGRISLGIEELLSGKNTLSPTASVLGCTPDSLRLAYTSDPPIKMPVKLRASIKPDIFHYVADTLVSPDSVWVYQMPGVKNALKWVETMPINISDIASDTAFAAPLKQQSGMKAMPDSVSVRCKVGMYADFSCVVPVVGINFPHDQELRAFPSTVKVTFQAGIEDARNISANDFSVVIDYRDIAKRQTDQVPVTLLKYPPSLRNVQMKPNAVEFLIEEKNK